MSYFHSKYYRKLKDINVLQREIVMSEAAVRSTVMNNNLPPTVNCVCLFIFGFMFPYVLNIVSFLKSVLVIIVCSTSY